MTVPDVVIRPIRSPAVSVNQRAPSGPETIRWGVLPAETYSRPGGYLYARDVPPAALTAEAVRIDFQLDKAIPPGGGDLRELGIIALSVALEGK